MKTLIPSDHRADRLAQWINEHFEGVQAAFIAKFELHQGEISRILQKKRTFGERRARRLEIQAGIPKNWLDMIDEQSPTNMSDTVAIKQMSKIKNTIDIPVFDVAFSMGDGAEASARDDIVSAISVTPEWVNTNLPNITSARNLRIGSGRGDSMTGTYSHGDMLFIDCGIDGVPFDGVYAFMLNDQLYIKRLQKRPDGSYNMISDNKQYEVFVISPKDKLQIFGRVVWAWNGKRL